MQTVGRMILCQCVIVVMYAGVVLTAEARGVHLSELYRLYLWDEMPVEARIGIK
jgi:hypothetical protein